MEKTCPLFIMISQTHTRVGRLIRAFSHYPYNHVSLTTDPGFGCWYSFARHVQDTPFYGGLVRETPERFLASTGHAQVRIFRLELPEPQMQFLEKFFSQAGIQGPYLYNYYDALLRGFGLPIEIPQAHTCLSFACSVLQVPFPSIEALSDYLMPHLVYEGDLAGLVPDSGRREEPYFSPMGLFQGSAASTWQFGALTCRLVSQGVSSYLALFSRRSVH